MAAEYDLGRGPNSGEEEDNKLHPRIVSKGTVDYRQLAKSLSRSSTFMEGEIRGLINALEEEIIYYLQEGYEVKLGDMGYFSLKLKSRPVSDPKEIRSYSISVDNVNFKASAEIKRRIKTTTLVRAKYGFSQSPKIDQEECKSRLLEYLKDNPMITRKQYSAITGLLKNKAFESLNAFVQEGLLKKNGNRAHLYYTLEKEERFGD